jgi:hypothetical protein
MMCQIYNGPIRYGDRYNGWFGYVWDQLPDGRIRLRSDAEREKIPTYQTVTIDELRLAGVKVENTGGRVMIKGEKCEL